MTTLPPQATRIGAAVLLLAAAAPIPVDAQDPIQLEHRATFHEPFGFLQTVRELTDGRVMVADPLGGILAAIHIETGAMDPVGREGGGPGEWRQPDAVFALPGDSTLVVDLGNTRLSVFDSGGGFVRSYPMMLAPGDGERPQRGGDRADAMRAAQGMMAHLVHPRATDAAGRIYFQGRGGLGVGGGSPDSLEVRRWDRDDAPSVRLAGLRPPTASATTAGAAQRQTRVGANPLSPQDDWAVAPDGRVALIRAEPYRVEWIDGDGRLVRGAAAEYRPLPVRMQEKQRWLDARSAGALTVTMSIESGSTTVRAGRGGGGRGPMADRDIDDYEWPALLPPFRYGGARVDPIARVWVERYNAVGSPALYDVFDARGARIAQITLPDGHRIIGFGRSAVYAARVDDLGLHWLEVFSPPR